MKTHFRHWLAVAAAGLFLSSALPPETVRAESLTPALLDELGHGGYVIVFRHASTTGKDAAAFALADCASQQALSEAGMAQARGIGAAFKSRKIPVGRVLASGYCRTLETARLAFGQAELSEALLRPKFEPAAGEPVPPPWPERQHMLTALIATAPAAGTNTILVTHGESIEAAASANVAYAGAAVFKPDGHGAATLVATIPAEEWSSR
jgi:broad specificity phosphatase PhoE